jgi:NAD(P)-dependent dehydrogenase (short-subunit alcohol dehydrogenase family)
VAEQKVCVVTGVGPGTGAAMVRRFHEGGYRVAMIARTAERLEALAGEMPNAHAYPCDMADPAQIESTLARVADELGPPSIAIHNAVGGAFGDFLSIEPAQLEANFQVNVVGLLHLGRAVAPAMIEAGEGAIIVTGNTSALRGKAGFAGFAPTKAAQRILAESMARSLGPQHVHVAYIVIDAVIDLAWTRRRFADQPDGFFIQPASIAENAWYLAHQDPSAWTFLSELRPHGENW